MLKFGEIMDEARRNKYILSNMTPTRWKASVTLRKSITWSRATPDEPRF